MHIPIIALAGSDNNLYKLTHAIPGNDSSRQSIAYFITELVKAYRQGHTDAEQKKESEKVTPTL
jgi:ribosomal protein S2